MSRPAVCSVPGCPALVDGKGRCGGTCHPGCEKRPAQANTTERGYGSRWRTGTGPGTGRDGFIRTHPECIDCGAPSAHADHAPVSRRDLVAMGDPDPDGWHHLQARCASCHARATVKYDGGYGNPKKSRPL